MAENNYTCLGLERENSPNLDNPLDRGRSNQLREQLVAEIRSLEEQLAALKEQSDEFDFSMEQTFREMIHSRQQLYLQLRR